MEKFQKLCAAASVVNCEEFAAKMLSLVQSIKSESFTKVAVVGLNKRGRRTFINKIVEHEVWTDDTIDDEAQPTRIAFERMSDNEKFNCVLVFNRAWNERKVLLFELGEEDFIADNTLNEQMYTLDMVFVIISATAPFNNSEVNILKATHSLKRQVIVDGVGYLREGDLPKIENYVAKMNESLELPPALIYENEPNCAKRVRGLVPAYVKRQQLREKKCRDICTYTADVLEQKAREALAEQKQTANETSTLISEQIKNLRANYYTLRMDVDDLKLQSIERVVGKLSSRRESIVNEILAQANKLRDKDKIQAAAEEKYLSLTYSAVELLNEIFLEDLRKVNSLAQILSKRKSLIFTEAEKFAPKNILEKVEIQNISMKKTSATKGNAPLLIGSAFVAGGLILAPLPMIVSLGGTMAAVGYGLLSYMKNKERENKQAIDALHATIRQAIDNIKELIRKLAEISYGKIIEQNACGEEAIMTFPPVKIELGNAELNDILQLCEQIKENAKTEVST